MSFVLSASLVASCEEASAQAHFAGVVWTTSGQTFTTSYTWTTGDKQQSLTPPAALAVSFTRDALARVASIATGGQSIVTDRTYRVDGLLTGQT